MHIGLSNAINYTSAYTFSYTTKGCYSTIYYLCVSSSLVPHVIKYDTVNSAYNFSYHESVEMILSCSIMSSSAMNADQDNASLHDSSRAKFRFDKYTM